MVTTRSQEKGLSTPVPSSKIEVIVPSATRSTPRTTDSPSTTRKTRSTPRLTDSTHKVAREMGTSASKAESAPNASSNHADDALANERHEDVKNAPSDPAHDLAQQNPPLLQEQPPTNAEPNTQESSTPYHDLSPLTPNVDSGDGGSTNLPERLKLSPSASASISRNTHKRFRSEEPEQTDEPVARNNMRDKGPSRSTIDSFTTPASSDESEGAPEVVSIVSRKSTNRSSKGRKRRRLEEDVVGGLKSPKHDHTTGEPSALEQSNESVGHNLVDGEHLESGALELGLNTSAMIPTNIDETDVTLPGTLEAEKDASTSNRSGDVMPSLFGKDTMRETGLAETGFKVPLFARPEAKISGLNVEAVNTTVLDDAESGSHTEAGSATLTNNSFATVPEHQSTSYGETTASASAYTKQMNLAENISLSLTQEASPKHIRPHQVRPRRAMPQPTRESSSSLQDYRQRLLNRNPRTNAWGPPGFRRTRFVGV